MFLEIYGRTKQGKPWRAAAIVDTGSPISIILTDAASSTGLEDDAVDLHPDEKSNFGIGGKMITAERKIEASWRESNGRRTFRNKFYLAELPEGVEMLLGRDWISESRYPQFNKMVLIGSLKVKGTRPRPTTHHSTATDLIASPRNRGRNRQAQAATGRASETQGDGEANSRCGTRSEVESPSSHCGPTHGQMRSEMPVVHEVQRHHLKHHPDKVDYPVNIVE